MWITKKKIVILIAAAVVVFIFMRANGTIPANELRIFTVKKGPMREFIKLRGKVDYDIKSSIYARNAGTLEFSVEEGNTVIKDSKIAFIDTVDLNIALKGAEAAYKAAAANLAEIKAGTKPEEICRAKQYCEQIKIILDSALADYNYKKDLYDKTIALEKSGSVSEQNRKDIKNQYDLARSAYLEAERRLNIALYDLKILKRGASVNVIDAAGYELERARAAVDEIKNNIAKAEITSIIDGVLLSKYFESGSYVTPGALLFETGDTRSAYIRADVLTDDIAKVKVGGAAIIGGDILNGDSFEATVSYIAPKAFTKVSSLGVEQQKIEVRLEYDKNKYFFRPGYEFDVDIVARKKNDAVFVPYKAVFDLQGRDHVFIIENTVLNLREVETDIENDDYIEIIKGLFENEKIVVEPPIKLKPGMKVKN